MQKHLIHRVEVYALRGPKPLYPHWTSHFVVPPGNEILLKLYTNSGIEGIGLATSYSSLNPLIQPWQNGFADLVIGEDATAPEQLHQKIFRNLSTSRTANQKGWSREALIRLSAAVDIACWDIIGKIANLPLYRLFGGFGAKESGTKVDVYATCGYYRWKSDFKDCNETSSDDIDLTELRDELQMMMDQGHKSFKVKTGGLASVEADIERLLFIRNVIGEDKDLMVDVNRAWDLETAIKGAKLLESTGINPRWLEEPVQWQDDRRCLNLLAKKTNIPISGGESEYTSYNCRAMLEEQAVQILQFDVTMLAGGFTEGRKLMGLCELNHVKVAPHHDCFIHGHLVASSPAGLIVEAFTDPERDPLQAELFENPPDIVDGKMNISEEPGLGLQISKKALEKFGKQII